ncbi:MAG: imidazole glycerol phosphate synthase subunit HisF [Candidatus Altiarchaeales archaeon]|nr:MAG: imidazole glycerol phosphate synthase subunit HisF [Candidatus Altiarchaeales archaeon]RLI94717.1 MAG: imidazole glycerol phosphate synthase subunit HisF [Candidatus Altiarchaeales archaeon]HDO81892.1 imidazole glycerol phosphate synthase subunit HisF [Candidatus Altiarchaeales archaeon]HEX54541.1 imidazole glycerol phosphate synthase subunit HisF [Candidatus Altiarchaeales archaeon]
MLTKRIIPCLDCDLSVPDGRVVKGIKFKRIRYAGNPPELASKYYDEGADEIVFLDITASHERRETMVDVIERTAENVFIPLTVGGGIKSIKDMRKILNIGADKITINTAAIKNPSLIREGSKRFGSQCIVVAIDAKLTNRTESGFECYIYGGRKATGIDALEWAKNVERLGAGEILLTSMDRDGTKLGFDIELTKTISENVNIPVIASGGVGNPEHIYEVFVKGKADAALAASIFHFNEYSIYDVKKYLRKKGINVRL